MDGRVCIRSSTFGDWYDLSEAIGPARSIVVFRRVWQREPIRLLLPHQLYTKNIDQYSNGGEYPIEVVGIPYTSEFVGIVP